MATKFGFGYVSKYLVDLWTNPSDRPSPCGTCGQPGEITSLLPTACPLSGLSPTGSTRGYNNPTRRSRNQRFSFITLPSFPLIKGTTEESGSASPVTRQPGSSRRIAETYPVGIRFAHPNLVLGVPIPSEILFFRTLATLIEMTALVGWGARNEPQHGVRKHWSVRVCVGVRKLTPTYADYHRRRVIRNRGRIGCSCRMGICNRGKSICNGRRVIRDCGRTLCDCSCAICNGKRVIRNDRRAICNGRRGIRAPSDAVRCCGKQCRRGRRRYSPGCQAMRPTRGLRQAVARNTSHHIFDGGIQAHPVPDGDIERLHPLPRAQYRPDHLIILLPRQ
uniref:Uncharacterized protein n=1 Tax=Candidatus Kentrum sp. UNK TaxID=2126344 RepID=A0A451AW21_9GAMM|nr:MAG: hypothetical protein BECKUNK1418G_GA0071005_10796 [Candidatus Kentron sp. UNK]VFK70260.1 MAG: hypothetical protein BECKUNK1418H_GA0071006_102532 [Candidatus Kentron sp. UNK]